MEDLLQNLSDIFENEFVINFSKIKTANASNLNAFNEKVCELIDSAKEKGFSRVFVIDSAFESANTLGERVFVVKNHINLTTQNPLLGPNDDEKGQRFFAVNNLYLIPESLSSLPKSVVIGINSGSIPTQEERNILGTQNGTDCCFTYNFVQAALIAAHRNLKVCGLIVG